MRRAQLKRGSARTKASRQKKLGVRHTSPRRRQIAVKTDKKRPSAPRPLGFYTTKKRGKKSVHPIMGKQRKGRTPSRRRISPTQLSLERFKAPPQYPGTEPRQEAPATPRAIPPSTPPQVAPPPTPPVSPIGRSPGMEGTKVREDRPSIPETAVSKTPGGTPVKYKVKRSRGKEGVLPKAMARNILLKRMARFYGDYDYESILDVMMDDYDPSLTFNENMRQMARNERWQTFQNAFGYADEVEIQQSGGTAKELSEQERIAFFEQLDSMMGGLLESNPDEFMEWLVAKGYVEKEQ